MNRILLLLNIRGGIMNYRISGRQLKKQLLKNRPYECEKCHRQEWEGQKIPLEVHHKDGNRINNQEENLQLLCPNCHTLTTTFSRNKETTVTDFELIELLKNSSSINMALTKANLSTGGVMYARARRLIDENQIKHLMLPEQKEDSNNYCKDCGCKISKSSVRCKRCSSIFINGGKAGYNQTTREELKYMIRTMPFTKIGKYFNVSDNAIRKWCKHFNLPSSSNKIKKYSDEEWDDV